MDLSGISPASVVASQMALTQATAGTLVMRKILDIEATQGAMLAQMVDQAAGLGRTVDTSA
jgi:hypothetical protein